MSQEESITNSSIPGRQPLRVRIDQMRRSRRLKMIGGAELVGLGAAILLALVAIFLYFYLYLPANSRLKTAGLDRTRLQGQVKAASTGIEGGTSIKSQVDKINASTEDFESNYLVDSNGGRMSLYTQLNDLIRENGLRNSAGPTYAPLEPIGTKTDGQTATAEKQSNAKWQTVYPGIVVTVTVEGPYQNIRRFVRDLETSRQFLIINALELEGLTQSAAAQVPVVPDPRTPSRTGKPPIGVTPGRGGSIGVTTQPRGTMVSLRVDLTTYFQRGAGEGTRNP